MNTNYIEELNESQCAAVTYNDGPSLVIAGAGSGKTRVLTYKIAYLLENGVQAEMVILLPPENDYEQPLRAFCDTLLLRPALRALHGRVRVLQEDDPLCAQALRALCALHIHAGEDLRTQLAGAPLHRAEAGGSLPAMPRLHQANGLGGFTQEGGYVILPGESRAGIAPWCHILANDVFGTLVCERGILFF